MKYDQYGQALVTTNDLFDLLYANPGLDITRVPVKDPDQYNQSVRDLSVQYPLLDRYQEITQSLEEFDANNQATWHMPKQYQDLDIAEWLIQQCKTNSELERVGDELLMYQEKQLFPLLCYLKYLVDVMREHNIVWGVGRGSSVSSYVLYLIGVHRINSLQYNLDIREFLRE
jgi:DNA polymerase III alpha subunit